MKVFYLDAKRKYIVLKISFSYPSKDLVYHICECSTCGHCVPKVYPYDTMDNLKDETVASLFYVGNKAFLEKFDCYLSLWAINHDNYAQYHSLRHVNELKVHALYSHTLDKRFSQILLGLVWESYLFTLLRCFKLSYGKFTTFGTMTRCTFCQDCMNSSWQKVFFVKTFKLEELTTFYVLFAAARCPDSTNSSSRDCEEFGCYHSPTFTMLFRKFKVVNANRSNTVRKIIEGTFLRMLCLIYESHLSFDFPYECSIRWSIHTSFCTIICVCYANLSTFYYITNALFCCLALFVLDCHTQ